MNTLSIITNFGCHFKCSYCIVKRTGIQIPPTTVDTLKDFLQIYKKNNYDLLSISGGGDPLYNYDNNHEFYDKLHAICRENNIPIEMHTSYQKEVEKLPIELYCRVVFHCNNLEELYNVYNTNVGIAIKRVVFVIEDRMDEMYIHSIVDLCQKYGIEELSFRQRVNPDYSISYHMHDFFKNGHNNKTWYYIEQGDYNTYFVNGKLTDKYCSLRKK